MRARAIALISLLVLLSAALAVWVYLGNLDPVEDKTREEDARISTYIKWFLDHADIDPKDGKISLEEFRAGYKTHRLDKSERETYSAEEAFALLDVDKDGYIAEKEVKFFDAIRNKQEHERWIKDQKDLGLVPMRIAGKIVYANIMQAKFIDAEISASNQGFLAYAGAAPGFARRYFGLWEVTRGQDKQEVWRLKKPTFGRVSLRDGKFVEGFIREGDGSEIAKKDGFADGKVFVLTYSDARVTAYPRANVAAIDYNDEAPQARYIKRQADPAFALDDIAANLEIARQCAKDGMGQDAVRAYQRVLIFQQNNAEALKALGLKLDGKQYAKAE